MPRRIQEPHALWTNEKDKQIAQLRQQLEAQSARSTLLRNQLTSTLNTMDTMRRMHEKEMSAQRTANARATTKLERLTEVTSVIERERDECRDAALELIQKVETDNEPSTWPHSRMRLTSTVEPAVPAPHVEARGSGGPSYASLIVSSLRAELEKERLSHTRTHEQAEREIQLLRSQLAQKDIKLQVSIAQRDESTPPAMAPSRPEVKFHEEPHIASESPLTPEDALQVLAMRAAKNKELQLEIRQLAFKLEKARLLSPIAEPETIKETALHSPSATPIPVRSAPHSPALRPYSPGDILSPFSMTPRNAATPHTGRSGAHPRPRDGPALSSLQLLEREIQNLGEGIDNFAAQRRALREMIRADRALPGPRDVDETSSQATAVPPGPEQRHLPRTDADAGNASAPDPGADSGAEQALREELEAVRLASAAREADLLGEIAALREALREYADKDLSPVPSELALWEDHDREESMELGTPLAPTAILWEADGGYLAVTDAQYLQHGDDSIQQDATQDDLRDPTTGAQHTPDDDDSRSLRDISLGIPLPISPLSSSPSRASLIRDRPPTPFAFDSDEEEAKREVSVPADVAARSTETGDGAASCSASRCACLARVQAIERELEETRRDVASRDAELAELRRLVTEARMLAMGKRD